LLKKLSCGRAHSRLTLALSVQRVIQGNGDVLHRFWGLRAQPGDDRPGFHNSYALRNWLSLYQHKVQTGLFVSPARARTEKRDVQAFQQCYGELEQALQQANLLILALHTMIDVAEQELQVPI
jgi:Zn-dependent oligopeptidase